MSKAQLMTSQERNEFRQFCQQATLAQLDNICEKERKAAAGGENTYRQECYQIALDVRAVRRGY